MADETQTIKEAIEDNAKGPASAAADGVAVSQHDIDKQISADRYSKGSDGINKKYRGMRMSKIVPPGSV